jgi:hypothetical protein
LVDDGLPGTSANGNWSVSGAADPYGEKSLYSKQAGATYSYDAASAGLHNVYFRWTEYKSRCTQVPVEIYDGSTLLNTVYVNQQQGGGQWNFLGTYDFNGLAKVVIVSESSDCSTCADAVSFVEADIVIDDGQSGTSASGKWSKSGGANPYGEKSLYGKQAGATYSYDAAVNGPYDIDLRWTEYKSRCTQVPVEIYDGSTLLDTVYVNQQQGGGQWNLLGSYNFTGSAKVVIVSESSDCSTCADAITFAKADIVIDDGQSGTSASGKWSKSGGANPYGEKSLYGKQAGATYGYDAAVLGPYDIDLRWTEYKSRCTQVPVQIYDGSNLLDTVHVNQQQGGGQWNFLGTYDFTGLAKVVIVSESSECSTCADAVAFAEADIVIDDGQSGRSASGNWSKSGGANPYGEKSLYSKQAGATYSYDTAVIGQYDIDLHWTEYKSRCTQVPVEIYDGSTLLDTVHVNQQQGGGQWNFLGTYDFSGLAKVVIVSESSECSTCADAIRLSEY